MTGTVNDAVVAMNDLVQVYEGKKDEIESAVSGVVSVVDSEIERLNNNVILPSNLINDCFFTEYVEVEGTQSYDDASRPKRLPVHGFNAGFGRAQIELVSARNFGFESIDGHYSHAEFVANHPDKVTDDPWQASYNKILANTVGGHPRHDHNKCMMSSQSAHDSLIGGVNRWGALPGGSGHLLRVFVPAYADGLSSHGSVRLSMGDGLNFQGVMNAVLNFSCHLYVKSGGISIGDHHGYNNLYVESGSSSFHFEDFEKGVAVEPFKVISVNQNGRTGYADGSYRRLDIGSDPAVDTEFYIGLPYLFASKVDESSRLS